MIKLVSSDLFEEFRNRDFSDRYDTVSWDLSLADDLILSTNSEKLDAVYKVSYFRYFIASGQSSLLADEELHVMTKFGSKTVISLFLNEIPEYIKEDQILMEGLVYEISAELLNILSSGENYGEVFPELSEVVFLKKFPKNIQKEYLYNYLPSFFGDCDLFIKKAGLNLEYSWSPHSVLAKISMWGNDYLLHRNKLQAGYDLFYVYRYDNKKVSEEDMKIINQAIIYKLWKM